MKVYYAHSLHLYNTAQEKRDMLLLDDLGFEIVNPSDVEHHKMCSSIRNEIMEETGSYDLASEKIMDYFMTVVDSCDVVAFRGHPDGKIPSGVGKEVQRAKETGKSIIELPVLLNSRFLDKNETRQYLELLGER